MKINKFTKKLSRSFNLSVAALMATAGLLTIAGHASAGSLPFSYIRETRMKSGQNANLRVVFKATAGGATGFTINMNGGDSGSAQWTNATPAGVVFNGSDTIANVTGCDVSAVADNGGSRAVVGATAGTITVTSLTALTSGSIYCYDITNGGNNVVTNPTASHEGTYHPTLAETGGATDSTTLALNVVSNDQVTINATVPPSFTFAIGGCGSNTDNFSPSTLTTSFVYTTSGCTLTVNTNASNGWYAWVSDANTGLSSSSSGGSIPSTGPNNASAQSLSNGTAGFVFAITTITQGSGAGVTSSLLGFGNGSGGAATACTSGSSTSCTGGAGLNGTTTAFASSTGTANGAVLNIQGRAAISGVTKAASDYQDVITLTGAGYF